MIPDEILVVDDDPEFRRALRTRLSRKGYAVREAGEGSSALHSVREAVPALVLLDLRMPGLDGLAVLEALRRERPGLPVIVLTGHGSIDSAVAAMKLGALDYLTKPCPPAELDRAVSRALERARLLGVGGRTLADGSAVLLPPLVGESAAMIEVRDRIARVARTDSSVLITGESGTGKEVVARRIHAASARAGRPLVTVNAAAIPESLLEAELFGHARGAFTGAQEARPGLFDVADEGTLFLDEIGELPLVLQAKLLRVLEDGSYRPVGSAEGRRSSARVISATNRELRAGVASGSFRQDLLYRLEVFTIRLPALRERPQDVAPLVRHRLEEMARRTGRSLGIADGALRRLERHPWPGNVRELFNVLEESAIVAPGGEIGESHLPPRLAGPDVESRAPNAGTLAEMERGMVETALAEAGGNRTEAARNLGISVRTLQRKLRRWREEEACLE